MLCVAQRVVFKFAVSVKQPLRVVLFTCKLHERQTQANEDEQPIEHQDQSNGHQNQSNGHQDQPNGHQDQPNGHQDQSNGHQDQSNGHQDQQDQSLHHDSHNEHRHSSFEMQALPRSVFEATVSTPSEWCQLSSTHQWHIAYDVLRKANARAGVALKSNNKSDLRCLLQLLHEAFFATRGFQPAGQKGPLPQVFPERRVRVGIDNSVFRLKNRSIEFKDLSSDPSYTHHNQDKRSKRFMALGIDVSFDICVPNNLHVRLTPYGYQRAVGILQHIAGMQAAAATTTASPRTSSSADLLAPQPLETFCSLLHRQALTLTRCRARKSRAAAADPAISCALATTASDVVADAMRAAEELTPGEIRRAWAPFASVIPTTPFVAAAPHQCNGDNNNNNQTANAETDAAASNSANCKREQYIMIAFSARQTLLCTSSVSDDIDTPVPCGVVLNAQLAQKAELVASLVCRATQASNTVLLDVSLDQNSSSSSSSSSGSGSKNDSGFREHVVFTPESMKMQLVETVASDLEQFRVYNGSLLQLEDLAWTSAGRSQHNAQHSDGKDSDGKDSDGKDSDGKDSNGKDSESESESESEESFVESLVSLNSGIVFEHLGPIDLDNLRFADSTSASSSSASAAGHQEHVNEYANPSSSEDASENDDDPLVAKKMLDMTQVAVTHCARCSKATLLVCSRGSKMWWREHLTELGRVINGSNKLSVVDYTPQAAASDGTAVTENNTVYMLTYCELVRAFQDSDHAINDTSFERVFFDDAHTVAYVISDCAGVMAKSRWAFVNAPPLLPPKVAKRNAAATRTASSKVAAAKNAQSSKQVSRQVLVAVCKGLNAVLAPTYHLHFTPKLLQQRFSLAQAAAKHVFVYPHAASNKLRTKHCREHALTRPKLVLCSLTRTGAKAYRQLLLECTDTQPGNTRRRTSSGSKSRSSSGGMNKSKFAKVTVDQRRLARLEKALLAENVPFSATIPTTNNELPEHAAREPCPICYDSMQPGTAVECLPCHHFVCASCAETCSLRRLKNCAVCRTRVARMLLYKSSSSSSSNRRTGCVLKPATTRAKYLRALANQGRHVVAVCSTLRSINFFKLWLASVGVAVCAAVSAAQIQKLQRTTVPANINSKDKPKASKPKASKPKASKLKASKLKASKLKARQVMKPGSVTLILARRCKYSLDFQHGVTDVVFMTPAPASSNYWTNWSTEGKAQVTVLATTGTTEAERASSSCWF
jgi:hypothetical protein